MPAKPTYEELEQRAKELEAALSERDKLIDSLPVHVMFMDLNYRIIRVNKFAAGAIGKTPLELIGSLCYEIWRRRGTPCEDCPATASMKTGRFHEREIMLPDGRVHHIRGYPVYGEDGEMIGVVRYSLDITENKQMEEALRQSEEQFRKMFEKIPVGIAFADVNTSRLVRINPALCQMLGYTEEELRGMTITDISYPDDMPENTRLFDQALKEDMGSYHLEKRYLKKNRETIWANLTGAILHDAAGAPSYRVGFLEDITERKQAEMALKKSKNLLEATGRMARVGGWTLEAETYAVGWTEEIHHIHEVPIDHKPSIEEALDFYPSEAREPFTRAIQRAMDHGEPYDLELPLVTAKGNPIWVRTICRPEVVEGKTVKLSGTFQDITDRKNAELAVREALAEKEVLLREIHHRVKNNMQAIIGLLRMHARRTNDAHLTEIFTDCRDRIGAMSLIHEALYQSDNLARIDFEAYLKKLCRNLAQAHDAPRRGITLTTSAAAVSLNMDRGVAVGMVIAELISNAFKHAFPDDEGGAVSVHLDRPDGETVRLVVSDTGKGLPADFDIQNPSSLGMRLVSGAVTRELGGTIDVESDNGARFIIRFQQRPTRF